jgi:hypothetical protein
MLKIKKFFRGLTLNSEFEKTVVKVKESTKMKVLKEKDIFGIIVVRNYRDTRSYFGKGPIGRSEQGLPVSVCADGPMLEPSGSHEVPLPHP